MATPSGSATARLWCCGLRDRADRWPIDGRGRLYVPVWLRRNPHPCLVVGTHAAASVVLVAPPSVLDGLVTNSWGRRDDRPQLRARVLFEEARVLGLDLDDLIAADTSASVAFPTVRSYLDAIVPTFTPATAATYRPYWRLLIVHVGDHRLGEVTIVDLTAVVDNAAARAQRRRPGSTGCASRETCVAALRALFRRAVDAGLVTANPAAALTKPRRIRSRRRALDDTELGELIDAVRTTSHDARDRTPTVPQPRPLSHLPPFGRSQVAAVKQRSARATARRRSSSPTM